MSKTYKSFGFPYDYSDNLDDETAKENLLNYVEKIEPVLKWVIPVVITNIVFTANAAFADELTGGPPKNPASGGPKNFVQDPKNLPLIAATAVVCYKAISATKCTPNKSGCLLVACTALTCHIFHS